MVWIVDCYHIRVKNQMTAAETVNTVNVPKCLMNSFSLGPCDNTQASSQGRGPLPKVQPVTADLKWCQSYPWPEECI